MAGGIYVVVGKPGKSPEFLRILLKVDGFEWSSPYVYSCIRIHINKVEDKMQLVLSA